MAKMVDPTTPLDLLPKFDSAGEVVRALRERAGLSLSELADRVGVDKSSLSKYENNQLSVSFSVLERIAGGLGVSPLLVLMKCLKHRYPSLRRPNSKVGALVGELVSELVKPNAKTT